MAGTEDRRAPGATRISFDALVEVGGALGPSFEAHAVNISEEGMLLRTAYLPEAGQPLTCRFESGGQTVLASGEVVWADGSQEGGEFAIRFTDMDPESVDALKRACGIAQGDEPNAEPVSVSAGSKVRLHIDGLASPMRAKIRDARETAVTVGSDLGFLQVGKHLDLEDAMSGSKRPARIDRVDVQVDPASHVPQLVVTLRYSDAPDEAAAEAKPARPATAGNDLAAVEEATGKMKGALARGFAQIGPAFERLATRTKTTIALLAQRRRERADSAAPRRTTSPAPGGGLHTAGRRVVRGDAGASPGEEQPMDAKFKMTKRKAAVAGAVMIAAVLGAIALKKSHHEPSGAEGATAETSTAGTLATSTAGATLGQPSPASMGMPPLPMPAAIDNGAGPLGPVGVAGDDGADSKGHKKHGKIVPFGNGPVHHGNVLHLKMDGPIDSIEGAQQPTGFAVKIPGRKSVEAAGPLAARDARIAAIKVANDGAGAELIVTFKDGVPNYQVSAKGDTLIVALAPVGALSDKVAKKDAKGGKTGQHGKAEHDKKKPH
jgi:hypothetical protein